MTKCYKEKKNIFVRKRPVGIRLMRSRVDTMLIPLIEIDNNSIAAAARTCKLLGYFDIVIFNSTSMKILSPTKAARPSFSTRELLLHMASWRQEVKKTDASLEKTVHYISFSSQFLLPPKNSLWFGIFWTSKNAFIFTCEKKESSLIYGWFSRMNSFFLEACKKLVRWRLLV